MIETAFGRPGHIPTNQAIIDCDVHNVVPTPEALFPYLSAHWREYLTQSAFRGPTDSAYPKGAPISVRPGAPIGSELQQIRSQVLEPLSAEYIILNCLYAVDSLHNPDTAAAMASAVNDWQSAEWLEPEPRLRASLVVPSQQPALAAREIDRLSGHRGFVQVLLPVRSAMPYGNRVYLPIFEAAARAGLVVGLHFGGAPGNPPTASGWPSYYVEEYAGMAAVFQTQLMSLVVEGVFDQLPHLRVALIESGFSWLPAFLWRFDKEWKGLRRETPWTRRLPSEYVQDHVRLTLQPNDGPTELGAWLHLVEQLGSEEMLLFATDFPHWQYDRADEAIPVGLPASLSRKILSENARGFYRNLG